MNQIMHNDIRRTLADHGFHAAASGIDDRFLNDRAVCDAWRLFDATGQFVEMEGGRCFTAPKVLRRKVAL